uniref:UPF0326 protein At4g17486 family n=1 Tax=Cajanus cajan TaxID=3821 RepID=A0A151SL19_CAJCA|nr:UPF0326 protein At4g17486 family [Cajanus cajan]
MPMLPLSTSSERVQDNERRGSSMVYLNVYDLTPANNYLYVFGVGIFHSGIEVYGMEYGFGAHEYSTSGVFEVEPRNCPGFIFRRSVLLGSTDMSYSEFTSFIERLSAKYHGDTYHLIAKNCNHFTDEVCQELTGKPIPSWVNRLARVVRVSYCSCLQLGIDSVKLVIASTSSFCNCLLPESLQVAAVTHLPEHLTHSDDEGSETDGLSESDSEDEHSTHHLLTTANGSGEVTIIKEKPMSLARDHL